MMAEQNISMERKFTERRTESNWRKSGAVTPLYTATAPLSERKVSMSKKGPTFLNAYAIPVLLLNLMLLGWDIISANIAQGWSIYLGYAVIVTVSLYLYLAYLDRYFY
jgi:hypothetical protein